MGAWSNVSKTLYLGRSHIARVALTVEQDEVPCLIDIFLFSASVVILRAQMNIHTLQNFLLTKSIGVGVGGAAGIGSRRILCFLKHKIFGVLLCVR